MLQLLEKQFSAAQQQQVRLRPPPNVPLTNGNLSSSMFQMRQLAADGGQPRPGLSNGPSGDSSPPVRPPSANGACSMSPAAGLQGHPDKSPSLWLGGGSTVNGNVPYSQKTSLPHTCAAASSTSSTSSPIHADDTWKSQQRNTTTQVSTASLHLSTVF